MCFSSRRDFLKTTGTVAAAAGLLPLWQSTGSSTPARPPDQRPNILFFFPDQHRFDWTGANVQVPVRTPVLDRITQQGVRFHRAYCASPLCGPSRACLAAGKEYDNCRVPRHGISYPLDQTTFYTLLRESGYHVMGCGKFDLDKGAQSWGIDGQHQIHDWGFSDGINNAGKWDAMYEGEPKDPYMAYLQAHGLRVTHVADFKRRRDDPRLDPRSFGHYKATHPTPLPERAYCDNWVARNGLELIRRAPEDTPWFLQVNFPGPHEPMDITHRMHTAMRARGTSFPQPHHSTKLTLEKHLAIRQNYAAMIENIDRWLGIYLDELARRGELENTLIVFSSDHGEKNFDQAPALLYDLEADPWEDENLAEKMPDRVRKMTKLLFLVFAALTWMMLPWRLLASEQSADEKNNFVLFIADDHDIFYTSVYGNEVMQTPNMDRLAQQGMVFNRAFTATAMCAPSRSMLYTGLFPHRNGAHPNHSRVRPGIRSLPHYLSELGYRVALAGKRHISPQEAFPFEYLAMNEVDAFLRAVGSEPFCLIIASDEPHAPHEGGGYEPDELPVAPYLVDTPETRQRIADYSTDINILDEEIGQALDLLEEYDLEGNTLFIYTSDHGAPLPYGKWTLYESGLQVPFIARWPGKIKPETSTDAMISFVDVLPTFIEVAGGTPPEDLDGRSFLPVLLGKEDMHREVIFGTHTNEGIRNGGPYPIRSIRTETHKYIVNLNSNATFTNNITESGEGFGPLWSSWLEQAKHDTVAAERVILYQHRPAEELYDLRSEPYELKSLAADPDRKDLLITLRRALINWMKQQQDPMLQKLEEQMGSNVASE